MTGLRDPRGAVTAFVTVLVVGLMAAAGLVLDGGRVLVDHRRAVDQARAAARAGAQAVEHDALRHRRPVFDQRGVVTAARRHLDTAGIPGSVRVEGPFVVVTTTLTTPTPLLALVGTRTVTVTGEGRARLVRGVNRGET